MASKTLIVIDPGAAGAVVVPKGESLEIKKLTGRLTDDANTLRDIIADKPNKYGVILERVGGYKPGNSGPASVKFARHIGNLEAVLYILGVPILKNPTPQQWMKKIGVPPKMEKAERKRWIKDWVARRITSIRVTLAHADALGMYLAYKDNYE